MIVIKGSARGGPADLARHLGRLDTNERMRIVEARDTVAGELAGALHELDALGAGLNTQRTLYHASINPHGEKPLTPEQWQQAVDRLEAKLGLTGQPRVVVEHEKLGREHRHVVWSRTDLGHMRAIRCDHNYRKHEEAARELEKTFGRERVQGAHAERENEQGKRRPRPSRTPSHAEMRQAERTGMSPKEAKAQITELWRQTDSGSDFAAALKNTGWTLARGDKRDFVLIDMLGEAHSLARRVDGARAPDIRARMADIDPMSLPTVDEARAQQRQRDASRERGEARPSQAEPVLAEPVASPPRPAERAEAKGDQEMSDEMEATKRPRLENTAEAHLAQRDRLVRDAHRIDEAERRQGGPQTAKEYRERVEQEAAAAKQEKAKEPTRPRTNDDIEDAQQRYRRALGDN